MRIRARLAVVVALVAVAAGCSSARKPESSPLVGAGQTVDTSCTGCHGNPSNGNAAPPWSLRGATATTDRAVGAHQQHLQVGAVRAGLDCSECHVVPANVLAPGHIDGTAQITWGPLASKGGVTPTVTVAPDGASLTCATYCHGASFAATNGSNHAPSWTRVDGSQAGCGTCHGVPPPAPHPAVSNGLLGCAGCHPGTVRSDGTIDVTGGLHIDGKVDIAGGACTSCHGDANRSPSAIAAAPPRGSRGETATTDRAVGAHQAHLVAGHVGAAVACTECHLLPTSTASHPNGTATVTFGTLASTGGVTPVWSGATCSTYCHGATLGGGSASQPTWTLVDGSQRQCGSCHGAPPPTSSGHPSVGSTVTGCASCHPDTVNADGTINLAGGKHIDGTVQVSGQTCTTCHGDPTRAAPIAAAPPKDTKGNTATTAAGVGAHQQHLVGGAIRSAMACTDCHTVPGDAAHAAQPLNLTWSVLASAGGAVPTWNATTLTCTNYCHGATLAAGGSLTSPVWTSGSSQAACGTCHGVPPPTSSGHPAVSGGVTSCAACHPDTVNADGTINTAGGKHIDGTIEVSGQSCTSCHGDPTRAAPIAAAPPKDTKGNTATSAAGVGAHQLHLVGGTIRGAMACIDCHAVPTDTAHASQPLNLTWSALAAKGVTPTWNATTLTCTNYCHGATLAAGGSLTSPVWTAGSSQAACGTCHAAPPPISSGHPSVGTALTGCASCHPDTMNANGTINVAGGKHVNGTVEVTGATCTACHGDATRTPAAIAPAPPRDTAGNTATTSPGVGAHQKHLVGGSMRVAMACADCHAVPSDSAHAAQPLNLTWSTLASTGVTPSWNATTLTCTNYCHGATLSGGGTLKTPVWISGSSQAACGTCHGLPPSTGHHGTHSSRGIGCATCHGGYTNTTANTAIHVNAIKEVTAPGWVASTKSCSNSCHGTHVW